MQTIMESYECASRRSDTSFIFGVLPLSNLLHLVFVSLTYFLHSVPEIGNDSQKTIFEVTRDYDRYTHQFPMMSACII